MSVGGGGGGGGFNHEPAADTPPPYFRPMDLEGWAIEVQQDKPNPQRMMAWPAPVVKRVIRLDVPVDKFPNVCMSIPLQNCLFSTLISCNNSFYTPSNLSSIILLAEFSDLVGTPWKESKPWLNVGFTFGAVALSRILLRYAYLLSNYTPPHLYNFFSQLLLLYRKKSLKRNPDMSTLKNHCMCWWRQSFQRI